MLLVFLLLVFFRGLLGFALSGLRPLSSTCGLAWITGVHNHALPCITTHID
jgi:hypothetical protein